jgi:osmoprotectant transport system substrate-binding protein
VLDRWPALARALDGLGGRLTADDMRRLDYAVDGEHRSPAEVVRAWRASPQGRSP